MVQNSSADRVGCVTDFVVDYGSLDCHQVIGYMHNGGMMQCIIDWLRVVWIWQYVFISVWYVYVCCCLGRSTYVCSPRCVWSSRQPNWPMSWGIGGNACYPLHAVNSYNWRPMHVPCYCNYFNISLYASTHITNVHLICMSTRQIQASISAETICWHSTKNSPRKPPSSHIHTSSLETTPHPIRSIQDIPT